MERLADLVPIRAGPWTVQPDTDLIVPDDTPTGSSGDQTLQRVYQAPGGAPLMLTLVHHAAGDGRLELHRSEGCYATAGFRLSRLDTVRFNPAVPVAAVAFTAVRGERVEQVLYWIRVGTAFPAARLSQALAVFADGLRGARTDGALVRLSIFDDDIGRGRANIQQFARALIAASGDRGRRLLIGRG